MRWFLIAWLAAGCAAPKLEEKGRVVFVDKATGFSVRCNESMGVVAGTGAARGEVGEIHPAVIEYVLTAEEGPLPAYYDLVLGLASPPPKVRDDLRALVPEATRLAGSEKPVGRHYARALARSLASEINRALSAEPGKGWSAIVDFRGTAALWWGLPADLDANVLLHDYERQFQEPKLRTVIYRNASQGLVVLRSSGTDRVYVWDVSGIPGAFDTKAPLDYGAVASKIVALHPFTRAPGRSP